MRRRCAEWVASLREPAAALQEESVKTSADCSLLQGHASVHFLHLLENRNN